MSVSISERKCTCTSEREWIRTSEREITARDLCMYINTARANLSNKDNSEQLINLHRYTS